MKRLFDKKIQKLGTSCSMNLPIEWIRLKKIEKGDLIYLEKTKALGEGKEGILLIKSLKQKKEYSDKELRSVVQIGTSYFITIPFLWIKENKKNVGSFLEVHINDENNLVIR